VTRALGYGPWLCSPVEQLMASPPPPAYTIEQGKHGPRFIPHGSWQPSWERLMAERGIRDLWLNEAMRFEAQEIRFLEGCRGSRPCRSSRTAWQISHRCTTFMSSDALTSDRGRSAPHRLYSVPVSGGLWVRVEATIRVAVPEPDVEEAVPEQVRSS